MQRDKTIDFWNKLYSNSNDPNNKNVHKSTTNQTESNRNPAQNYKSFAEKEWIVQPSPNLFHAISNFLPTNKTIENDCAHVNILEIGCGVSYLSREFWRYLQTPKMQSNHLNRQYSLCATDVSSVCIQQMIQRDNYVIHSSEGLFHYSELNVLEKDPSLVSKYDMILDKGCLDTFLFRSQHKVQWEIMNTLLDNIHSWLKQNGGVYLILSPRSKIKPVRDYLGFQSVQRIVLNEDSESSSLFSNMSFGELDGRSARSHKPCKEKDKIGKTKESTLRKDVIYMYVCVKNDNYIPGGTTPPFEQSFYHEEDSSQSLTSTTLDSVSSTNTPNEKDELMKQTCSHCGTTFQQFIGSDVNMGQGEKAWKRRFRNHVIHCRG